MKPFKPLLCNVTVTHKENVVDQGWAINFARGHFQKAAFSGEDTFLWKQMQVSVKLGSALTFTMVRWRIFQM